MQSLIGYGYNLVIGWRICFIKIITFVGTDPKLPEAIATTEGVFWGIVRHEFQVRNSAQHREGEIARQRKARAGQAGQVGMNCDVRFRKNRYYQASFVTHGFTHHDEERNEVHLVAPLPLRPSFESKAWSYELCIDSRRKVIAQWSSRPFDS